MATAPGTAGRTHRLQGFRCRTRPAACSRRGVTAAAYALLSLFLHMMLRLGSLPFARLCVAREREAFAYLPRFHPGNDLSTLLPARLKPYPPSSSRICDADGCRASQIREIVALTCCQNLVSPDLRIWSSQPSGLGSVTSSLIVTAGIAAATMHKPKATDVTE